MSWCEYNQMTHIMWGFDHGKVGMIQKIEVCDAELQMMITSRSWRSGVSDGRRVWNGSGHIGDDDGGHVGDDSGGDRNDVGHVGYASDGDNCLEENWFETLDQRYYTQKCERSIKFWKSKKMQRERELVWHWKGSFNSSIERCYVLCLHAADPDW